MRAPFAYIAGLLQGLNWQLGAGAGFGGGDVVISIANAATVPSTDPAGGGILYCQSGALKYRGSSGTITTIGAA